MTNPSPTHVAQVRIEKRNRSLIEQYLVANREGLARNVSDTNVERITK